jgi:type IV fimbrial biogenesis protein FimT
MKAKNSGFTLIELMITVAIVSILLSVGLPSFKSIIDDTRLTSTANAMLSAYQLAKSEALKTHKIVTVSSDDNWKTWGVKIDTTKIASFESSKSVSITKYGDVTGVNQSGRQEGGSSCTDSKPPPCGFEFSNSDGSNKRYLVILLTGRMKVIRN